MSRRWNGSSVMAEFEKIAADRGLISSDLAPSDEKDVVGNPHKDNPEWTRHKETEDYDITGGTGAGIIEKAHPSPVTVADAMGEGALVENQVEQHRKHVDVATREMPHGTLVGIHASLASELLKLAASLDAAGDEKAARKIDESVGRMLSVPFGKAAAFDKNAFLGLSAAAVAAIKWIAIGLGAAGAAQYALNFTGRTESLHEDIGDLIEVAQKMSDESSVARLVAQLVSLLMPYKAAFSTIPSPGTPSFAAFLAKLGRFGRDLPRIEALVKAIAAGYGGNRFLGFLGFSADARLLDKLGSVKKGFNSLQKTLTTLARTGKAIASGAGRKPAAGAAAAGLGGLKGVQALVGARPTGVLDDQTKAKLKAVEERMEKNLAPLLKQKDLTVKGMLLRPDGSVIGAQQLRRLLALEREFRLRGKVK